MKSQKKAREKFQSHAREFQNYLESQSDAFLQYLCFDMGFYMRSYGVKSLRSATLCYHREVGLYVNIKGSKQQDGRSVSVFELSVKQLRACVFVLPHMLKQVHLSIESDFMVKRRRIDVETYDVLRRRKS